MQLSSSHRHYSTINLGALWNWDRQGSMRNFQSGMFGILSAVTHRFDGFERRLLRESGVQRSSYEMIFYQQEQTLRGAQIFRAAFKSFWGRVKTKWSHKSFASEYWSLQFPGIWTFPFLYRSLSLLISGQSLRRERKDDSIWHKHPRTTQRSVFWPLSAGRRHLSVPSKTLLLFHPSLK